MSGVRKEKGRRLPAGGQRDTGREGRTGLGKQSSCREGQQRESAKHELCSQNSAWWGPFWRGVAPLFHVTPTDDCCPLQWQNADNTFLVCSDFQSPSLGHPSLQDLIKRRKVIKEGHVTFPVTLNLITPPPLPHFQSINMTHRTTRCNTKLFIAC